jgi:para-nitrobenzyl esterase
MRYPYVIALAVGLLAFDTHAISQTSAAAPGDPVKIDSGLISGKLVGGDVKAYLGIPYAAPPVGNLRWRETQPVKPWTGVRPASEYGAPCAQRGAARGGPAYSEDCLFLNVWAPARPAAKKLPVIVFIYGGGYTGGSSSMPNLSGEFLARKGVVYVNFNYRLSVLGSLATPELIAESPHKAASNYVHTDEIAVLQWIHRNIAQFGGDPGNVTLMGQSSGGMDTCFMQSSPLTKGLIHRVFAMSGSTFPGTPWGARPLKNVEQAGVEFQAKLGVKSLADMRALPWEKLLETSWIDINEPAASDGYVLPEPTPQMFAAHKQTDVPTIVEWCRDETFAAFANVKTLAEFKAVAQSVAGAKADELLKLYPATNDEEARQMGLKAARAGGVQKPMMAWALAQAATGKSPVYASAFSYGQSAGHGRDVGYWHGTVSQSAGGPPGRGPQITAYDNELSDKMMDALIAFAKTGDPNTAAVKWPKFDPKNPIRIDFGERIETVPVDQGAIFFVKNPDVKVGYGAGGRGPGGPGGAAGRGGPGGPGGPQGPGR